MISSINIRKRLINFFLYHAVILILLYEVRAATYVLRRVCRRRRLLQDLTLFHVIIAILENALRRRSR